MSLHAIARMYGDGEISTADVLSELGRWVDIPLSEGQRGLWALHRMEPNTYAYNVPVCFSAGHVDVVALEAAFRDTISRHPLLSARIRETSDGPFLSHGDPDGFSVECIDISDAPREQVLEYLKEMAQRPFDLTGGPLVRLAILRRSDSETFVLLAIHHMVIDGASARLVIDTLFDAYQARLEGRDVPYRLGSASFGEFVAWEKDALAGPRAAVDREFWQRELAGAVPLAGLPSQATLPPDSTHEGEVYTRRLSAEQVDAVAAFAASHEISPGSFFLAAFTALLHRYTGEEDIVIGMPVSGRPMERLDAIVGYFVNTLPIRSRPVGSDEFIEYAQHTQSTVFDVLEHGTYPFHRIVHDLGRRDTNLRSPVYQIAYNYQDSALSGYMSTRATTTTVAAGTAAVTAETAAADAAPPFRLVEGLYQLGEYDLTLDVVPGGGILLNWKYHPDAFSTDAIGRMANHFAKLIDDVIASDGRTPIGRLSLLGDAERRLVLQEWNHTTVDYPAGRTCWDLFVEQAGTNPDSPAVTCGERTLSYRELADRSSALAAALPAQGIGSGSIVGVCCERSLDLIVGLLAVMKLGAAYVPLDATLPAERLSYMVEDSGAELVLCHDAVMDKLATVELHGTRLYATDHQDGHLDDQQDYHRTDVDESRDPRAEVEPAEPPQPSKPAVAYVIYTSGSTGKPKGVVVPHKALTNFLLAMARTVGVTSSDRLLAVTTHSFDIAALELYLPLITGGQVYICDTATATDATLLADKIAGWQPTVMQATPATWSMLLRVGWQNAEGIKVLCGGEALPDSLKDQLVSVGEAWNLYGPTETTIWSTAKRLSRDEPVTIGRPIANTQVYILDEALDPMPVGVSGELYISGDGVALGYHRRRDLTAERFLDNPFLPGRRLYRTGDLARWLPNGEIVLLGRIDNQVKLRGYRIELGEIEAVLDTHPEIRQSVVVVEYTGRTDRLTAYYTRNAHTTAAATESAQLRAHLAKILPGYMVPAAFVALEAFPLTPNGKIDRAALAEAGWPAPLLPAADEMVPAAEVERTVHRIFGEVLGIRVADRSAGFFDIGGDSFTAVEAVAAINREFGCTLRPTSLFAHSSVAAMAWHLSDLTSTGVDSTAKAGVAGRLVAASAGPGSAAEPRTTGRSAAGLAAEPAETTGDDGYLDNSIAVIGLSCRFPGAKDHREFWRDLVDGRSGSGSWSTEELRALGVPDELIARPGYVPQRSVVDGRAEFDAAFFGISPRDAELMDPQARLLLQHAWAALEDAGYRPEDVPDTSVTTATSTNFYQALLPGLMANASGTRVLASADVYAAWLFAQGGTVPTMISTKLGLRGPSMAVSTNCSSALSAVHLACRGLLAGEVRQAIAGAASLFSAGELGYVHQPGLNFSSDGRSRAFADGADGMSGGEGVGVVVLKRARDALADADQVYCLIRGIAVNNDGGDKAGFYAPSVRGQTEVIRKALDVSGVDPATICYVEAHGTGTKLGDPIEVAALTEAYRHYTDRSGYCGIGSVKSNIGHLDAAAGMAGLIKLALALRHGEVPRTLHCDVPSAQIDWDDSPFFVADRNLPLGGDGPARAALSSFGIGGTNVHAVLEQARPGSAVENRPGPHAVVLSARDGERLGVLARELLEFLPRYQDEGGDLASLAYTLQVGRRALASRVAFVAGGIDELTGQLRAYSGNGARGAVFEGTARPSGDELVGLFVRTRQLRDLAAQWLESGEWDKVAPLWVNGVDVDWRAHHGTNPPHRVSLPTYPFAPTRFWPDAEPVPVRALGPQTGPQPASGIAGQVGAAALLAATAGPEGVDAFLTRRARTTREMDGILRPLVLGQLMAIGLLREPVRRDQVDPAGVIAPGHAKWLDHAVTVLLDGGELVRDGGFVVPSGGAPGLGPAWRAWREFKDAQGDEPELAAKTGLTERMIVALPEILSGRTPATAVMFPDGSFDLVGPVYRGNATADYFNAVTAAAVRAEVDARRRGAIRILEIGAGTGSSSESVFAQLDDRDIAEYCYTDVSKAFLIDAERRFGDRVPYLTFAPFDAEREPAAQGLAPGTYDIVIANNVLHATRDVTQSVRHARALLRAGGVLLLNELARNEWWSHLTFGLLEGWWRPADGRRIAGGPALSPDSWRGVLGECGFDAVEPLAEPARELGQQVLLARAGASAARAVASAGPQAAAGSATDPASRAHAGPAMLPAARGSLEDHVREAIERILVASLRLRRDELAVDQPFADYGVDSLTGVAMVRGLNESLGTDLDPSVLFEHPSIRRLTGFVLAEEGAAVAAHREIAESVPAPVQQVQQVRQVRQVRPAEPIESAEPAQPVEPVHLIQPTRPAPAKAPAEATETSRGSTAGREPIAIIGMSGRFPGARDVDEFWDLLVSGRDPVVQVSRWDLSSLGSACADGGLMDGVEEFDPLFFGISGAEAAYMEPQQRLFLQEAWRALEDAGHTGDSIDRDRCGIYVGCAAGDYLDLTVVSDYPGQAFWGNMNSLVPSRIAYYLDLHGPAMAVDTACSSSLVSVYLACQGLWSGEISTAIAGGVYVQSSPRLYLAGSRAGMLSPTGRCRSFDQTADGFVPAEGVGALILKRLSDAEADGDHIHGVISGIGINQDGTTNGITAPNGTAQERLIRQVYTDFAIDPEGIGLIEAHGTGTKLGDPVEFRALDRAFRAFTAEERFCSLGSSKANIGHTQSAAGVIGIIKALLAIEHAVIPGLLHHTETNSSVTLAGSPFFVHTSSRQWAAPRDGRRRAAISSLGASGTNAHAVIEQAPPTPPRTRRGGPRLITLSAATEQALGEQVTRLARHCREHPDLDLGEMSYTLLLGRRHLRHRWARVVPDIAVLERSLTAWPTGQDARADGTATREQALAAEFLDGRTPDFTELFRDGRYRRMPLPGYPFERERYSLPRAAADERSTAKEHPAADEQPADQEVLTGSEFFLRDHRVQGSAIAPGAMYLQWACAAARRTGTSAVCLQDIVFLRPLTVSDGPRALRTTLRAEGAATRFEVSSTQSTADEPVVHCQGTVASVERTARRELDLPALLRDMESSPFDPARFYSEWRDRDIDYGPALQGVVSVRRGDDAVLAQLRLPDVVGDTVDGFALHPALVDSAMQCMRLLDDGARAGLVFAIKSAESLAPCQARMWAWVRRAGEARGRDRIDIDLAAEDGTVCLRLQGITGRRAERIPDAADNAVTLMPVWDPVREPQTTPWPAAAESVVIIAATQEARDVLTVLYPRAHIAAPPADGTHPNPEQALLGSDPEISHLIWVAPGFQENRSGDSIIADQDDGPLRLFRTVKALLAAGYADRPLGLTLITQRTHAIHDTEPVDPTHAGVAGLAGSVAKEYPNWRVRVADVDAYDGPAFAAVLSLPAHPDGDLRIRRDGLWHRQQLMTVQPTRPAASRLRDGGTYVLVGGAGGLGTAISGYLIRRYRAQVVWLGRSRLNPRIEAAAAKAADAGGPEPLYLCADATSADSVQAARNEIVRRFGAVHGVIHSGLVLSGASLARMSQAQFESVLRGKVDASVRLMEAFGGDSLDFALFLSSINSYLKAIKQANYAAACTFMDSYALTGQSRHGITGKVLNLGYCFNNAPTDGEPGAVVSADAPLIQPDELAAAIELLCASPVNRLAVMKFGPALNTRGITVGQDEVILPAATRPSGATFVGAPGPTAVFGDLERLRARTAQLTALAG
ncbi:MAG TPA: amino acid adenylation domain-containing protein [Actinocrinis sp.]|nr:amino acid adenylation domain-containing protein [Actinocrinis sp.]